MEDTQEVDVLRAKVAELESQNRNLQAAPERMRPKARARSAAALILVLVSALLAPVAVLGSWVRAELVNTDSFVQTLAPLAEEPEVKAFVAGEVSAAINQNVDVDGMVSDLFAGIAGMDLPPQALTVLPLLEGSAANGVKSLIDSGVESLVESPQFGAVWETALRETHGRAIAVIQSEPGAGLELSTQGTLSLDIGVIVAQVRAGLVDQGIGFAANIPDINRSIPIVSSESFVLVRTLYQVAVGVGFWLPWAVGALLVGGVLLARNRVRTLAWAGAGVAAAMLLALAGLGVGKWILIGSLSPSVLPAETAGVLFTQVTELATATFVALTVLFLLIAVGAWLSGTSKGAASIRGLFDAGFVGVRKSAAAHGLSTGSFGYLIDRWHSALLVILVSISVVALFLMRPMTVGGVIAVVLCLIGGLLVVELLRRPAEAAPIADAEMTPIEAHAGPGGPV